MSTPGSSPAGARRQQRPSPGPSSRATEARAHDGGVASQHHAHFGHAHHHGHAPPTGGPRARGGRRRRAERGPREAMAAQRMGKRVLSKLQSPSRARGPGSSPGGIQKRHARVTVKYDRRELQRRLEVEQWIDGCLEELYRGREADMPDEVNIDDLLELETEEERARKIQSLLTSCTNPTEDFTRELLEKLRDLHKHPGHRQQRSPSAEGSPRPPQGQSPNPVSSL